MVTENQGVFIGSFEDFVFVFLTKNNEDEAQARELTLDCWTFLDRR